MKKILVFLLSVLLFSIVSAQTLISLDFTINQNGSQLLLDSVLIENSTTSTDTMIYYPDTSLEIDMLSGIEDEFTSVIELSVQQNFPNPFNDKTYIEVYCPEKGLTVSVVDFVGKTLFSKPFVTERGLNTFVFTPGADSQYIVNFSTGNMQKSVKVIHSGKGCSNVSVELTNSNASSFKSSKIGGFTYTEGESLNFTAYTTACFQVEQASTTGSPVGDEAFSFDYTSLTDIQPDRPVRIPATVTETGVSWNWSEVADADAYKYNTTNDYETATDIGSLTDLDWSELIAGTYYSLFVWAYNDCGVSFPLHIVESTTPLALSLVDNDLITSGTGGEDFTLMYICQQPDSLILRNVSTNVNLEEENLDLLIDRMKTTVLGEGVGIAAPQIGINRNVIWVQRYDAGGAVKPWEVYINPLITAYSDTVALRNDGCLSVSGDCISEYGIQGNSYRSIWVDVQYYDIDGNFVQERITHQFTAHIFQHEIDHLNGIMYFDRQVEESPGKYKVVEGDSYDGLPRID